MSNKPPRNLLRAAVLQACIAAGAAVLVACPAESLDDSVLERLGGPAVVPLDSRQEVHA